jgi:DHA1 family tetracycline resistance protein-like MFS transporter
MKFGEGQFTIFVIMVTEVLGFSLILPFLPFYAQDLGASPFVVGLILTSFSLFQLISAPIMGSLSDNYGRKPLLIISQFSTFLGFLILGFSNSLWMLFLSRIVDGLLGSNFTIAQSYLSDISSKKNRSKAFGLSGAAFGFGFLLGPAIGGLLSRWGYNIPSFIAAGVSFLTIIITIIFLKETVKSRGDFKFSWKIFHLENFRKFFRNKQLSRNLWKFFSVILTHSIYVSGFAMYAQRQLGFNSTNVGFVLTYIGFISIIIRGFLLNKIIDYFGEDKLQFMAVISILLAMTGIIFITEWWMFMIIMTLFSFGSGVSRPLMIGEISRKVSDKEQGAILGVTSSLGSVSQIIGPFVSGFVIEYFFPGSLGIVTAGVILIGLVLLFRQN